MNTAIAKLPLINVRYLLIGIFMLAAAGLVIVLTPRTKVADHGPKLNLETLIPKQFGEWRVDDSLVPIQVSPDVQASLNKIYNQTLARTYINGKGQRIMLSIAYGADQSDNVQVHLPEGCYAGQGFAVEQKTRAQLQTTFGAIPVARLVAHQRNRQEPITYWVVVGDQIALDFWEIKKIKLRYTLKGEIAEGLLFRLSNITPSIPEGYEVHQQFAEALLAALTPEQRMHLIGRT